MRSSLLSIVALGVLTGQALAQDFMMGGPTYGGSEPLYQYDDLDVWKHGWIQVIPYYGGYHSFRPYNYKQVFSQSAQAAAWGMPHSMPYSQQFYHPYENFTGNALNSLSMQPAPSGPPPSAMHQSPWNSQPQSLSISAGYDHRQGAAFPHTVAPVSFEHVPESSSAESESEHTPLQNAQLQQLLEQASQRKKPTTYEPIFAPAASAE